MASINSVVSIAITKGSQAVSVQAFNVATIFGPSARFVDAIRYYTNPSDMLADGFLISDPEFVFATELMSQTPSPDQFGVSHFTAAVAQIDTIAVSTLVASGHLYTFTLNGTPINYTSSSDTQQSILTALLAAAIAAFTPAVVSGSVSGTGSGALLTLTSTVPGAGVTYTAVDADLTHLLVTANHSIVQDIVTLQLVDDSWYGVLVTSHISSDIEQVAAYIESQLKFYLTSSSDSGILTSSTSDVASVLAGKKYNRTALLYHATPNDGIEAAWMGRMFPTTPGSANWNFKTLSGISPDKLNTTQINNAQGKTANVYVTIAGVNIATLGVVTSGEYIDVTILLDWIKATMQANIFSILVNNPKIPYTNKGIISIENGASQTLQQAQDNGGLAAGWTVTGPDVSAVSTNDKATRTLNNVKFAATLAGAINKVNIQGFISV